jgi:hypothetical protein
MVKLRQNTEFASTDRVHDAEGLLELLDSGVGEGVEDVCFLGHDETGDRGTGPATGSNIIFKKIILPWSRAISLKSLMKRNTVTALKIS